MRSSFSSILPLLPLYMPLLLQDLSLFRCIDHLVLSLYLSVLGDDNREDMIVHIAIDR